MTPFTQSLYKKPHDYKKTKRKVSRAMNARAGLRKLGLLKGNDPTNARPC